MNFPHMNRPCPNCPWRTDSDPGEFPSERYEVLRNTAGSAGCEVPVGGPVFACHKTAEGRDKACAGWLAIVGIEHLSVRLAIIMGDLPGTVLRPGPDWPELFESYEELADRNKFL